MRKSRKNYTPVEKVAILRRHLIDRVSISDLCDEYQLSPTLFYAWQKLFFENGASAFERKSGSADQCIRSAEPSLPGVVAWPPDRI
jgi:transposase